MTMLNGTNPEGILSKGIVWNYNIIINSKNFYEQPLILAQNDIKK